LPRKRKQSAILEPVACSVAWLVDACGMHCSWCSTGLGVMVAAGGLQILLMSSVCGWNEAAMMFFTGLSVSCGCHIVND